MPPCQSSFELNLLPAKLTTVLGSTVWVGQTAFAAVFVQVMQIVLFHPPQLSGGLSGLGPAFQYLEVTMAKNTYLHYLDIKDLLCEYESMA